MKLGLSKKIGTFITIAVVALLLFLPFLLGTKTYPIAVVQGNSMYPNLQNGDLVLFKQANPQFFDEWFGDCFCSERYWDIDA